jgi:hypothetical protein
LQSEITILDAHVHIHECFELADILDHAFANFRQQARLCAQADEFNAVLMLTESYGVDGFGELLKSAGHAGSTGLGEWQISLNAEPVSLSATSTSGDHLSIIAGRQIVAAERLEILALGFADEMKDGLPIRDVISSVQAAGALCVLPWGFGKWTGKRGAVVRDLLEDDLGDNFFVGDNSGRLGLWPAPPEFGFAASRNIAILPGSDPLPYSAQVISVGQYGLILNQGIDRQTPFEDIRRILLDERGKPLPYGSLERLVPFIRNQVAMQLKKFAS